jgi:hypothetical protein
MEEDKSDKIIFESHLKTKIESAKEASKKDEFDKAITLYIEALKEVSLNTANTAKKQSMILNSIGTTYYVLNDSLKNINTFLRANKNLISQHCALDTDFTISELDKCIESIYGKVIINCNNSFEKDPFNNNPLITSGATYHPRQQMIYKKKIVNKKQKNV